MCDPKPSAGEQVVLVLSNELVLLYLDACCMLFFLTKTGEACPRSDCF